VTHHAVAGFTAFERVVDGAAILAVAAVLQYVQRFDHASELGQGTGQSGGFRAALQGPQDR
jgi:hypothetical protein